MDDIIGMAQVVAFNCMMSLMLFERLDIAGIVLFSILGIPLYFHYRTLSKA